MRHNSKIIIYINILSNRYYTRSRQVYSCVIWISKNHPPQIFALLFVLNTYKIVHLNT